MNLKYFDYGRKTEMSKTTIPCVVYFGDYNVGY